MIAEVTDLTKVQNNWEIKIHYMLLQKASIN